MQVAKALIAFDAKINAVNIDDQTPLGLVPRHSELEKLLVLLGAMRYHEIRSRKVEEDRGLDAFLDEAEDEGFSTPPESTSEMDSE